MQTARLILVGGFLGAGKTTLLAQASERLARRGMRVGRITNDQAANLVDTAVLGESGLPVLEVSGGCFCCRFEDLMTAADRLLLEAAPDVLLGEPVGSCTDLSATVLQPIKQKYGDRFHVAPFSVLIDAAQVRAIAGAEGPTPGRAAARFPENVTYIYRKQLEEADLLVLNKADLAPPSELAELEEGLRREFPSTPLMTISAFCGDGVDEWLDHVLGDQPAGRTIAEVDYDQYADGEAALGWLNAAVRLEADGPSDWRSFCLALLQALQSRFHAGTAEIAHLKLHLTAGGRSITANLTGSRAAPSLRGAIPDSSIQARLLLNVRAHIGPDALQAFVRESLEAATRGRFRFFVDDLRSFSPSRPQPLHRYQAVV